MVDQMRRVMTVPAFFTGPKIQKPTLLSGRIWPEKFGVGLDRHPVAEARRTHLTPSGWHVKQRDVDPCTARGRRNRATQYCDCRVEARTSWPLRPYPH